LSGSTLAVALMGISLALPQLVVGLIAGVFVDRWNKKRLMIGADILRGLMVLAFMLVHRVEDLWIFYVVGFVQVSVATFSGPARLALVPTLVDKGSLMAANALSETTEIVARVIGTGLAGVLVGTTGTGDIAFALDGLSFFLSAVLLVRIASRHDGARLVPRGVKAVLSELVEGGKIVANDNVLIASMVLLAAASIAIGATAVLMIPFLSQVLKVRTEAIGIVEAAQVVGTVVGSGFVAALAARLRPTRLMVSSICIVSLAVTAIGASPNFAAVLTATFCAGLCFIPFRTSVKTLFQSRTPEEARGRTFSATSAVVTLSGILSMGLAGLLGEVAGIRNVFYLVGVLILSCGVLSALRIRGRGVAVGVD